MSSLGDTLALHRMEAEMWCAGKSPWARLVLLLYLAYAGVQHMLDPMYRSLFGGITLMFHEMGHLIFAGMGNTMMLLGGSIMQVLVPLFAAVYLLLRQGDYFGFAVGGSWLAFAEWELALYIWDAAREELPLVGFGDDVQHDWGTLLTQWGWLNQCDDIAWCVRALAVVTWASCVVLGAWLCFRMWSSAGTDDAGGGGPTPGGHNPSGSNPNTPMRGGPRSGPPH